LQQLLARVVRISGGRFDQCTAHGTAEYGRSICDDPALSTNDCGFGAFQCGQAQFELFDDRALFSTWRQ
jgi:hypothetical protein